MDGRSSGQLSTLLLVIGGLSSFAGNECCVLFSFFQTPHSLLLFVLLRMIPFSLMFVYALSGWIPINDVIPMALLALIGFTGGYANGRAYVLAGAQATVNDEKRTLSTLLSLFEYGDLLAPRFLPSPPLVLSNSLRLLNPPPTS